MPADDPLRALWRDQPTKEMPTMTIEALRERSHALARKSTVRNWAETVSGVLAVVPFVWLAVALHGPFFKLTCAMIAAGEVVVLVSLWRRGTPRPDPPLGASTAECLVHYRSELARERDLLAGMWRWYLVPVVPWLVLLWIGTWDYLFGASGAVLNAVSTVVSTALVCAIIVLFNRRASRKLARELEALDAR